MVMVPEILLIECHWCKATMGAAVKGSIVVPYDAETQCEPFAVTLAQCPKCQSALVGLQEWPPDQVENIERVWPAPPLHLDLKIPLKIQQSLREAHKCLTGGTFTASVAMSGRALEGLVRHFTTPTTGLQQGIAELHLKKIIDDRLNEWAQALHLERNAAAHFSGLTFNQQEAEDIFKFTNNICEYVFVLSKEFEEFQHRKGKKP